MYIIEKLKIVLSFFFAMIVDGLLINEPFNFDILKLILKPYEFINIHIHSEKFCL